MRMGRRLLGSSSYRADIGTSTLTHMRFASTIRSVNTWDETKRVKNLSDHGIDFADLDGFFHGDLLTREDARHAYGELRLQSIGLFNGVALFVVWTPRAKMATFLT